MGRLHIFLESTSNPGVNLLNDEFISPNYADEIVYMSAEDYLNAAFPHIIDDQKSSFEKTHANGEIQYGCLGFCYDSFNQYYRIHGF